VTLKTFPFLYVDMRKINEIHRAVIIMVIRVTNIRFVKLAFSSDTSRFVCVFVCVCVCRWHCIGLFILTA